MKTGDWLFLAAFRKALGIRAGDQVMLRVEDDELRITTMKSQIQRARTPRPKIREAWCFAG